MKNEDIKVITEFMNWEFVNDAPEDYPIGYWMFEDENEKLGPYQLGEMQYPTDWNWAMGVYEKIVDWCDEQPVHDDNPFPTEAITEALCNPDLESFVEEMVNFIKWYNEQTTTEDK